MARSARLAVVAVAVDANGAGLAVEVAVELAVALGAISLVVSVIVKKKCRRFWQNVPLGARSLVVGVMVKKKRHCFLFGKAWTPSPKRVSHNRAAGPAQ